MKTVLFDNNMWKISGNRWKFLEKKNKTGIFVHPLLNFYTRNKWTFHTTIFHAGIICAWLNFKTSVMHLTSNGGNSADWCSLLSTALHHTTGGFCQHSYVSRGIWSFHTLSQHTFADRALQCRQEQRSRKIFKRVGQYHEVYARTHLWGCVLL